MHRSKPALASVFPSATGQRRNLLAALVVVPLLALCASPTWADDSPAPLTSDSSKSGGDGRKDAEWWTSASSDSKVDSFGAYSDAIPIEVPSFHSIAPSLKLSYRSSGGNGSLGVGWDLAGVSKIERASPGKGAPNYDATDVYLLGGEELVPCATGSVSPSCTTGGTHSTKSESYSRIALSGTGTAATWTVTGKDGTKAVYGSVLNHPGANGTLGDSDDKIFRWGLKQEIDTKNNAVTYTWGTNLFGGRWEYLDSIAYNGTTIKLWYEARTDIESAAMGGGQIEQVYGRIKTIDVSVSGSRLRAYKLTYGTSGATSRSLLTSVQQFGTNATLDASGTVTGGTSLPAVSAGYAAPGAPTFASTSVDTGLTNGTYERYISLDINGDGKTDMLEVFRKCLIGCTHTARAWISNGSGGFTQGGDVALPTYGTTAEFLAMDVNGDGKDDFVSLTVSSSKWLRSIFLSNGTGFTAGATDTSMDYTAVNDGESMVTSHVLPADIDGDGKTDLIEVTPASTCMPFSCPEYRRTAWLSTGSAFVQASTSGGMSYDRYSQFFAGDFNGDGKSDFIELDPSSDTGPTVYRRVWLSNGTGFVAGSSDTSTYNETNRFLVMDANGDGKSDLLEFSIGPYTSTRKTFLSTGDAFALGSSTNNVDFVRDTRFVVGDFNGDGRSDYAGIRPVPFNCQRTIYLSSGSDFVASTADNIGTAQNHSYLAADLDGDGRSDMVELYTVLGAPKRLPWRMSGVSPDLATSFGSIYGGTTTIGYTPSTAFTNVDNKSVVQTATSVTVNPGRGAIATTTYSFSGGAYDAALRRSLGFSYQKQTLPCNSGEAACPYNETWYRQDKAALGKASRIDLRDGAGNLHRSEQRDYTTNTTVPWTALETGRWVHMYVGNNAGTACPGVDCKRRYRGRTFNAYGDVTQEVEYGDYDVTGDEKTVSTLYVPNTTAYIVSRAADVKMYQGVGTTGMLLNETTNYYDGATTWNQAPSAGFLTKAARWLSSPSSFVVTETEYDAWGNATATVNELGARTTVAFDATYHLYPTTSTNPLNQASTKTWDAVCSVPTSSVNLNGQTTTTTYDALCRVVTKTEPGGKFETHAWSSLGNPNLQFEEVTTPGADATGAYWTRRYFDGVGRTWRTAQKGPDAATGDIYADVTFHPRGEEATKTAPYFYVSGTPAVQVTTYSYDAMDRPVRVTHPDGAFATTSYSLWSVTGTDELGRAMTDRFNAYGQRVAHEETVGGSLRTTTFAYDARQNLQQTTDPAGNITTTNTTDSLGRVTQSVDLDWGTTTYEYDGAGRLTATVDAKNQRTTIGYDALDRKTSKTTLAGTAQATTVSWTYDQPRAGFYNVGSVTTTTDGAGTKTLDYDVLGRLVKSVRTINGSSFTMQYGFDAGGRSLWTTYPDGDTLGTPGAPLAYDGAGRLKSVPGFVSSATYNPEGGVKQITNVNGTTTTRAYSTQRRWLTGITTVKGATTLQNLGYARNAKGMITGVTSPIDTEGWTYGYDELDRLTSATNTSDALQNQTLTYDAIGNITSNSRIGTYTYHATKKHAVATAGAGSYAYDASGLMTSGPGRTMTWGGDNRLATVTTGGVTSTMTYDADGDRIQQVEGSTVHRYLGDDYEIEGDTTTKYVSLGGVPVATKSGTTKTWIHTDHLGSIQAKTDASGVEVLRKKYRAYGEILSASGSQDDESRGYTAQRHDGSGLIYLHARYYDGSLGRFVSADDVIDGPRTVGINRYAYTQNDPINNSDVLGRCSDELCPVLIDPLQLPGLGRVDSSGRVNPVGVGAPAHATVKDWIEIGATVGPFLIPGGPVAQGGRALWWAGRSWWASTHMLALGVEEGGTIVGSAAARGTVAAATGAASAGVRTGTEDLFVSKNAPFTNTDKDALKFEMEDAARRGLSAAPVGTDAGKALMDRGSVKWVVTQKGELIVGPTELSHAVIGRGEDVLAGGYAFFGRSLPKRGRVGLDINPTTGHYRADNDSLRTGVEAFERYGITFKKQSPRGY